MLSSNIRQTVGIFTEFNWFHPKLLKKDFLTTKKNFPNSSIQILEKFSRNVWKQNKKILKQKIDWSYDAQKIVWNSREKDIRERAYKKDV